MKHDNLFTPLLKTIDKMLFGIEEIAEPEIKKKTDFIQTKPEEEESDVQRSMN